MRKTTWLAIGLSLVIGLSGCGGRRSSETEQPKTSSIPTISANSKASAEPTESQNMNTNNKKAIDQLIDSLDELGDLIDSLDPVEESSLIIPEA